MKIFRREIILFVLSRPGGRHFETYFAGACAELYNKSTWALWAPPFWTSFRRLRMPRAQIEAKEPRSAFMECAEQVREGMIPW